MSETKSQSYAAQWLALSRYELLYYTVWIGGAVLALVLGLNFRPIAGVFGFLWLAGFFAAGLPLGNFCCPRCGKKFFSRPGAFRTYNNIFTSTCLNCGLPKWQAQD